VKLFGRDLSSHRSQVRSIHKYAWYLLKCLRVFRGPLRVIRCYVAQTPPEGNVVELRSGMRIFLSGHPQDIVTVFVIFIRQDYGEVRPGETVLDIGANIGVFSLYAAARGARAVHAFEPNTESYGLLLRNIRENGLDGVIVPHRAAVAGRGRDAVRFPKGSSMYNAIPREGEEGEFEDVRAVDLDRVYADCFGGGQVVDLLKLDCEGAEYDILRDATPEVFRRTRAIRLEYHHGREGELMGYLAGRGYRKRRLMKENPGSGTMWVERTRSQA